MILGSGNAHELPDVKNQAILGFHFDYTSGLPVIAGSSIKGVLRSAFKHPEYIASILEDESIDVKALEAEIFEHADIFFDATIIKADINGRVLGDDYLTPHSDLLKDPVPLRLIKVLPDVTFLFQFELQPGILSKPQKERLFRTILTDLGLGAKTNVGYGKLNISNAPKTEEEKRIEAEEAKARVEEERRQREAQIAAQREAKRRAQEEKAARLEAQRAAEEEEKRKKREALVAQGLAPLLEGITKYKRLDSVLKTYMEGAALGEDDKRALERHLKSGVMEKVKRKKFPFGTLGDEKCLGKERANNLADEMGLR
jgi:CRISPR-associated protein Cmr6